MDLGYLLASILILATSLLAKNRKSLLFSIALALWVTSEIATQLSVSLWASSGYVLFYPAIFLAIPALFEIESSGELVRLLDGVILVLGSSAIISALLFRHLQSDFLHLLYPICDLILLIAVLVAFVRRPINARSSLVLSGFLIYTFTDISYLIDENSNTYTGDSLLKYGWLLGFLFLSVAQFRRGIKSENFPPIPIFYLAISVLGSSYVLTAISLGWFAIPNLVIGPALATLFVVFMRMSLALIQSQRKMSEANLAKLDDLTGLPNRRRFLGEIEKYQNGSILLMDLDGFKPVNDNYGHETGDEILKQVSTRFLKAVPDNSLLARLGGDEFAVLTEYSYEEAMELAMALRATLSYPFNINGEQIRVDVSIGCVINDGKSDLMARADTAMYQAKKGQVGVWAGGT